MHTLEGNIRIYGLLQGSVTLTPAAEHLAMEL